MVAVAIGLFQNGADRQYTMGQIHCTSFISFPLRRLDCFLLHTLPLFSLFTVRLSAMPDNDSEGSPNEQLGSVPGIRSGRFGYTPIPSEQMVPLETPSGDKSRLSSPTDVFGLVLLLGAVREIWQLNSLFCYRGLWQDDRKRDLRTEPQASRQEVVLTIATGTIFLIPDLLL